jgi:hypothetical protein
MIDAFSLYFCCYLPFNKVYIFCKRVWELAEKLIVKVNFVTFHFKSVKVRICTKLLSPNLSIFNPWVREVWSPTPIRGVGGSALWFKETKYHAAQARILISWIWQIFEKKKLSAIILHLLFTHELYLK